MLQCAVLPIKMYSWLTLFALLYAHVHCQMSVCGSFRLIADELDSSRQCPLCDSCGWMMFTRRTVPFSGVLGHLGMHEQCVSKHLWTMHCFAVWTENYDVNILAQGIQFTLQHELITVCGEECKVDNCVHVLIFLFNHHREYGQLIAAVSNQYNTVVFFISFHFPEAVKLTCKAAN